jgi:hypothetical protein
MTKPNPDTLIRWGAWVHVWWTAAIRQAERIKDASFDEMQPDVFLFVQALNNLVRGATRILGANHDAVQTFNSAHPGLKDLRNMVEHFDEYAAGDGRRSLPSGTPFEAFFSRSAEPDFFHVGVFLADQYLDVSLAKQAGDALAMEALTAVHRKA